MRYSFRARSADNTLRTGVVEAADAQAARAELAAAGLVVESLEPMRAGPMAETAEAAERLSNEEVVELTAQIAELAKGKVPLASGLRALSLDLPRGRQARVMNRLADHLDRGIPLDEAANMPDVRLPPYLRGLLACGLKNERLGLVLEQYLSHERLRDDLRRRVWSALAYPAVLMLLLAGWCYFAAAVLLPDIADIMASFGTELPHSTQLTFAIGKSLPWIAVIVGSVIVAALALSRFGWHAPGVAAFFRYLPVTGRLGRYRAMIEFSDLLGLLAGEKVPMPTALELTATAVTDGEVAAACRQAAQLSAQGLPLAACLGRFRTYPRTLLPFISWGDRMSDSAGGLAAASRWFRARCDLQCQFLALVVPPITFVLMASVLLFTLNALFAPLLQLIQSLT